MDSVNQQQEDVKVDILECGEQRDGFQDEEEVSCEASSSSFGDSLCAHDDNDNDDSTFGFGFGGGEEEAQSMLSKDYPLPEACGFYGTDEFSVLKKKKVTDDWRRFCQPLMWRCKWLELKVKEIESQARVYEKEVNDHYETKLFDLEKSKYEGLDAKSIPFRGQRNKVFKRGRRKRVEETTDVDSYLSNHNLFSYAEKRKPATHKAQCPDPDTGTGRKVTSKDVKFEEDCLVSGLDCSDDFLAKVLCKIDETQERARGLRERVDRLTTAGSLTAQTSSMMPRTIARSRSDLTIQNGKQHALLEEPSMIMPRNQREATVQIGRQRVSAVQKEDLLMTESPPPPLPVQVLNNESPHSCGGLGFQSILEDLLLDDEEMDDDEPVTEEDKLNYFTKLINDITNAPSEEADAEEDDPTPVTKRRKTSH